ncbi:MAG: RNA 2',3'-cyclic phosphodiesterase [Bacteroidota bacterium]|nr:RNA 2',3'-cyclic phosphodiesterase [Bacteroidota bacterium]
MTKKTFVAIKISPDNNLKNIYQKIKLDFQNDNIKWIDFNNFHITLKYLGVTKVDKIEEISSVLEKSISRFSNFELVIKNFGVFPTIKSSRVFWLGIEKNKTLLDLQKEINISLKNFGFPVEKREFKPHLTIARPKVIENNDKIILLKEDFKDKIICKQKVDRVIFYESNKGYFQLKTYKLST